MSIDTLNIKTPIPCVQGFFGERLVSYTTQISPTQIVNLLGHDPRSKNWKRLPDELRQVYEFLQRKTAKSRRESVAGYIEERLGQDPIFVGAFPAISIALQNPAEFVPYDEAGKAVDRAVGRLMVDVSPLNFRVVIDGLGRISGAMDLLDDGRGNLVRNFFFPVTLFAPRPGAAPLSWREMGQLFHDFNFRVQPVSRQHALALDNSDLYILLANKLGERPVIANNGGVAERQASLGAKSPELVTQALLLRAVRGATEGRTFQKANLATAERPNLTKETFGDLLRSLDWFFGSIADRMGADFARRDWLHLSSAGWQAFGVLHHDIVFRARLGAAEKARAVEQLAAVDWSRTNPDWRELGICRQEVDQKSGAPATEADGAPRIVLSGAGDDNVRKLIAYLRKRCGLEALADADEPAKQAA